MTPDLTDPWVWPWFLLVVVVGFLIFELYAFYSGKTTLSRYIHEKTKAWPPLEFFIGLVLGILVGGLGVHLYWQWCADQGTGIG
jgi:hypothetical protein